MSNSLLMAHRAISKRVPFRGTSVNCWLSRSPARLKTCPASGILAWIPGDAVTSVGDRASRYQLSSQLNPALTGQDTIVAISQGENCLSCRQASVGRITALCHGAREGQEGLQPL